MPVGPKTQPAAHDEVPVGGGGKAEVIEIDMDWGEPPPRLKKRFGGKKKGKGKKGVTEKKNEKKGGKEGKSKA